MAVTLADVVFGEPTSGLRRGHSGSSSRDLTT